MPTQRGAPPVRLGAYEIAVLIPCYNEALSIASVVRAFRAALPRASIYVYDNNSSDDTARIAAQAGAIVRVEARQGKGSVVRRMFRDIQADLYVLVDGDGTYEAAAVVPMVEEALAGPYDLVNGVRVSHDLPAAYRPGHEFGNRLLTSLVQALFGNQIVDMLSGYKVLSRRFVKSFPVLSSGFEIETELAVHALSLSLPIANIECDYSARPQGSESKLNTYEDGKRILLAILDLVKQERPLLFFSWVSATLAAIALILAAPLVFTYLYTGAVPRIPTAILVVGIMLLAFGALGCGLILDTVSRGRREAKLLQYASLTPLHLDADEQEEQTLRTAAPGYLASLDTRPYLHVPIMQGRRRVTAQPRAIGDAAAQAAVDDEPHTLLRKAWFNVGLLLGSIVAFALISAMLGKDNNWDLRNYHYYNGYALLTGAWLRNIAPAQLETYLTPTLDIFTYYFIHSFPPLVFGMLLGGFQGINFWLVFQISARVVRLPVRWLEWVVWFGCAAVAMYSPTSVAELGNTMQDLTTSVFVLAAMLLLLIAVKRRSSARSAPLALFVGGGVALGIATGLKFTNGNFAVLALLLFALAPTREGVRQAAAVIGGGVVGLLGASGYWMLAMQTRYGSPIFPLYNTLLRSPYALPVNFAGAPFFPKNLREWIFMPFYFTKSTPYQTLEIPFQNLTFAAIYLLLIVACIVLGARFFFSTQSGSALTRGDAYASARIRLVVFFVLGFISWEVLFSTYRYASPLELLAPVIVCVLLGWLIEHGWLRGGIIVALLCVFALTMYEENWGRQSWQGSYFIESVPYLPDPAHSLVVMTSNDPISYVLPAFPAGVRFVRIEGNFTGIVSPQFVAQEQTAIRQHSGPLYVMTTSQNPTQEDRVLAPFAVTVVPGTCAQVAPMTQMLPGSIPAVYLCTLAPAQASAAVVSTQRVAVRRNAAGTWW